MEDYLNGVTAAIHEAGFDARVEIREGPRPSRSLISSGATPRQFVAMATLGHDGLNRMVFSNVTENVIYMIKVMSMLLVPGRR